MIKNIDAIIYSILFLICFVIWLVRLLKNNNRQKIDYVIVVIHAIGFIVNLIFAFFV